MPKLRPAAAGPALVLGLAALAAACSTPARSAPAAASSPPAPAPTSASPSSTPSPRPTPPPPPPARVALSALRLPDGSVVTLAVFTGGVTYALHAGSGDPGPPISSELRGGPAISPAERPHLLAAFNGGFKLSAGVGGYYQEGHLVTRLQPGLASLVIYRSGQASVGIWGDGVPAHGQPVYSVMQNLPPLVAGGRVTPGAADWQAWGATLGGGEFVARSALGENRSGQLMFAASMSTSPADLAAAMVRLGCVTAMELDINPEWVQLDVAAQPGGPLRTAVPGQGRPADQYLTGWTRPFVAVLAG